MMKKKTTTPAPGDDLAAAIESARAKRDELAALLAKRQGQRAEADQAAERAAAEAAQLEQSRDDFLVPARHDQDVVAKAALDAADEQAWRIERERRDAAKTKIVLHRQIQVLEHQVQHATRELARLENRAAEERKTVHRVALRALIADQVGPLLGAILAEMAAQAGRARAAGLDQEANTYAWEPRALAAELGELLYEAGHTNKVFARSWHRPARHERARIPGEDPDTDPTTNDAATAA